MVLTVAVIEVFLTHFALLFCFTVSFSHLLFEFHSADIVLLWCYAVGCAECGLATAKVHGNNRV